MKAVLVLALLLSGCVGSTDDGGLSPVGPAAPVCDDELDWFRTRLWEPILSVECLGCHQDAGPARETRMILREPLTRADEESNFDAVRSVALAELSGTPVLLLRPTLRHPEGHTGGLRVPVDSAEYRDLEAFAALARTETCDPPAPPVLSCDAPSPGARSLRRLSRAEYDATVRDLLGIDQSRARTTFAADPVVHGFDNQAASLEVSPLLADQLRDAAEALAAEAVRDRLDRVVDCVPEPTREADCARQSIVAFGERAFRRPLTDEEIERYLALWQVARGPSASEGSFSTAIELVVTAMLQSPHFLYRPELGTADGDRFRLSAWEVASQLSYLLWGTMPDDALFEAARSGVLDSAEGRLSEARRLVADPRARATLLRFAAQWLDYGRIATVPKDPIHYPELTPDIRTALAAEADAFVERVVLEGRGSLVDLLVSPERRIDPALAGFYGVGDGAPVDSLDPDRRGVLTLGAVLATHARPNSSSPVHRGRLVRERILCQELPPPPPGIMAVPPPLDPSLTTRERYRAHSAEEPCNGCHRQMDPIGFAFERYDGIGRYRTAEGGHPIDAAGEIVGLGAARPGAGEALRFDGTAELAAVLVDLPQVADCFVTQWFRFAYGVEENEELACLVRDLGAQFHASELTIADLLVALATSDRIVHRRADPEPTSPPPIVPDADAGTPDGGSPVPPPAPPPPTGDELRVESIRD
ncbi:MAG: DUF1592 domain-containing protein, partial [Deltaproteobacteria bacterium]|nr:DUF1592 domain-containing protein [Deltaproteobacteria bacterium]